MLTITLQKLTGLGTKTSSLSLTLFLGIGLTFVSCEEKKTASSEVAVAAPATIGSTSNMVGTLSGALLTKDISDLKQDPSTYVGNQRVEIKDLTGKVVATGTTDANGKYSIPFSTGANAGISNSVLGRMKQWFRFDLNLSESNSDGAGNEPVSDIPPLPEINDGEILMMQTTMEIDGNKIAGARTQIPCDFSKVDKDGNIKAREAKVQTITAIKGVVELDGGASPLGAHIYIPGTSYGAYADAEGKFNIGFLPVGEHNIMFEKLGYSRILLNNIQAIENDTVPVEKQILRISKGPVIDSFAVDTDQAFTLKRQIKLKLKQSGAIKYKISIFDDFRDASYEVVDSKLSTLNFDFVLTGDDGLKTIYIKLVDADSNAEVRSTSIILDTAIPKAPSFKINSTQSRISGYTASKNIQIQVDSCSDVKKIFITEDNLEAPPSASLFTATCDTEIPTDFILSDGEQSKELYLWAMDGVGQISLKPKTASVILDKSTPSISVNPGSGYYNEAISVSASTDDSADIFYTIDDSTPSSNSSKFTGSLTMVSNTTLKMVAIDRAGNKSDVIVKNYNIDRDAPILGSVVINSDSSHTISTTVTLTLSAISATKVMASESSSFLNGTWVNYASSLSFTFANATNGTKTIYVKFKDDAGNELGKNGDISDSIILDTIAPDDSRITLFYPETPSGSFDKTLAWVNEADADLKVGVAYEIQVFNSTGYASGAYSGSYLRSGTTVNNEWAIKPPLEDVGTYYWRMRLKDSHGNASSWHKSGSDRSFTIRVLGQTFGVSKEITQSTSGGRLFGYGFEKYGDRNNNGSPDFLVATNQIEYNSCANCSIVQLIDSDEGAVLNTFFENTNFSEGYGQSLEVCDVNGDNTNDYVIAAPYANYTEDGVTWRNNGKVFAYDGISYQKLFEYTEHPDPNNLVTSCNYWGLNGLCQFFGWQNWIYPGQLWLDTWAEEKRLIGTSLSCVPSLSKSASNPDRLLIGAPGALNSLTDLYSRYGKVVQVKYTNNTVTKEQEIFGTTNSEFFGYSFAFLRNTTTPTSGKVVVGAPIRRNSGSEASGSIDIFNYDQSALAFTNTTASSSVNETTSYLKFGFKVKNLGDFNSDGLDDVLAGGIDYNSSKVILYNSANFAALKTFNISSDAGCLGYSAVRIGSPTVKMDDDNGSNIHAFAIGAPCKSGSGNWSSGAAYVFNYGDVNTSFTSTTSATYTIQTGISGSYLGNGLASGIDRDSDGDIDSFWASSPSQKSGADWDAGAIAEFSSTKLAPSAPSHHIGTKTGDGFGSSIEFIGDINSDGYNDFVVGMPNADSAFYQKAGRLDFISGQDMSIMKTVSGSNANYYYFNDIKFYSYNSAFFYSNKYCATCSGGMFVVGIDSWNVQKWVRTDAWGTTNPDEVKPKDIWVSGKQFSFSPIQGDVSSSPWSDNQNPGGAPEVLIGATGSWDGDYGRAYVFDQNVVYSSNPNDSRYCLINGVDQANTVRSGSFGYSVSFIPDINGDSIADIAIGAPLEENTSGQTYGGNTFKSNGKKGRVYIYSGALCRRDAAGINPNRYKELYTDNALFIFYPSDQTVSGGFGNGYADNKEGMGYSVVGTSSLDSSTSGFLFISNMSHKNTNSTVEPEVLIYKDSNTADSIFTPVLVNRLTGSSGSLFGANIYELPDINGDTGSKPEIGISALKGQGTASNTSGQVTLYSGSLLATTSNSSAPDGVLGNAKAPNEAILHKFYNSGTETTNFGSAMKVGDINSDSLPDFLIGSPKFSSATNGNIGKILFYKMNAIKK